MNRTLHTNLTCSSHSGIITTVNEKQLNPNIRVMSQTRKKLKMLAAHYEISMLDVVEKLAQAEIERIQKGEKKDEQDIQIPPLSD